MLQYETLLVTGGAGFIGSNLLHKLLSKYEQYHLINLDALTYAGDMRHVVELDKYPRHTFIKGDIGNQEFMDYLWKTFDVRGVIHLAAESHVDNSIEDPCNFMKTNVMGTYSLLEAARRAWLEAPFKPRKGYENCRFHHVSTDEVYGSLGEDQVFTEATPYAPNSPYSSSKAASDLIVRSYFHTYGLNTVITNCSNNYGPRQHDEKLIPTVIRKALAREKIPVYGRGENIRDWLFVDDHCEALDLAFHNGRAGETYNIGSKNEWKNLDLVREICSLLDKRFEVAPDKSFHKQVSFVQDRPGHDYRYAIDPTKIEKELSWLPKTSFIDGLALTVDWYIEKYGGIVNASYAQL